jgi:predicted dehydrogenase
METMSDEAPRKLNVGVLGCGPIAQAAHFEACRRARNATLYAICDVAEDLLARMTVIHRPNAAFRDYDEMLADPAVDAVIVAIADQFHMWAAKKALLAGKHVLVEKPLGVSVEECVELRDLVRETGLVLQVGTMKRFDPGIAFAKRFIDEEMGERLALKAWYCDSTHRYAMTGNVQPMIETSASAKRPQGDPKADRRRYLLLGHGSHLVDTARFLGGPIEAVRAKLVKKFDAHCWLIDVDFADGSAGQLDLTVAVRMDWHEGFTIYGEFGSVVGKTYNPWYFKGSDVECFSERDGVSRRLLGADAHFYRLQLEGFADAILDGAPMQGATVEDGLAAVQALVAIARSTETGERVAIAEAIGAV